MKTNLTALGIAAIILTGCTPAPTGASSSPLPQPSPTATVEGVERIPLYQPTPDELSKVYGEPLEKAIALVLSGGHHTVKVVRSDDSKVAEGEWSQYRTTSIVYALDGTVTIVIG